MTELYIHIGHYKTGTSTIQHMLLNNIDVLHENGIATCDLSEGRNYPAAIALPFSWKSDDRYYTKVYSKFGLICNIGLREKILNKIDEFIKNNLDKKLIISSEFFADFELESVVHLKHYFQRYNLKVKIICYVRNPYETVVSARQQEIKNVDGERLGKTDKRLLNSFKIDFRFYLEKYINCFGKSNVIIREFNQNRFVNGDLIADFFDAADAGHLDTKKLYAPRVNESLSMRSFETIKLFNEHTPNYIDGKLNPKRAQNFPQFFVGITGDKFTLPNDIRYKAWENSIEDIVWLRKIVGYDIFPKPSDNDFHSTENISFNDTELLTFADKLNRIIIDKNRSRSGTLYYRALNNLVNFRISKARRDIEEAVLNTHRIKKYRRLFYLLHPNVYLKSKKYTIFDLFGWHIPMLLSDFSYYLGSSRIGRIFLEFAARPSSNMTAPRMQSLAKRLVAAGEINLLNCFINEAVINSKNKIAKHRFFMNFAVKNNLTEIALVQALALSRLSGESSTIDAQSSYTGLAWNVLVSQGELQKALEFAYTITPAKSEPNKSSTKFNGSKKRAVIIDPGFSKVRGHHLRLNEYYRDILNASGYHLTLYAHNSLSDYKFDDKSDFCPTLTSRPYLRATEKDRPDYISKSAANKYFQYELSNTISSTIPEVLVLHSARNTTILGLIDWLSHIKRRKELRLVLGIIDAELDPSNPNFTEIIDIYSQAFGKLNSLKNLDCLLFVETEAVKEILAESLHGQIEMRVVPYPVSNKNALTSKNADLDDKDSPITVGFLGDTRIERGVDLVSDMKFGNKSSGKRTLDWILQINGSIKFGGKTIVEKEKLAAIRGKNHIRLYEDYLPNEVFDASLEKIDVMLLPYSSRYHQSGSGVFYEALARGKIVIIPTGGWMESTVKKYGGTPVLLEKNTAASINNAVEYAADNFESLQKAAHTAANNFTKNNKSRVQLEEWISA